MPAADRLRAADRFARGRRGLTAALALLFLLPGCPALIGGGGGLPTVPLDELPATQRELLAVADKVHRGSRRVRDLIRARTALLKAELLAEASFSTTWRLARVDSVLARLDEGRAAAWATSTKPSPS